MNGAKWGKAVLACLLLCGVCLLNFLPVCAREFKADDTPVAIQADKLNFDQQSGMYAAEGKVDIQQQQTRLQADKVYYNTVTGDADAEGNVQLDDPDGTLSGEQLNVNMRTSVGVATQAKGFLSAYNFHISGDEISKLGARSYQVKNGFFTTCDAPTPAWKFAASKFDVTVGGYATAKHVKFYLYDIPVLYFPYMAYPVNQDRQSGFLMPMGGYSADRGMQISTSYYQVLGRNMDATFYLDHFSKMGLGSGVTYRYIFGEDNAGVADFYYISSYDGKGYEDMDDGYALRWDHHGTLPWNVRLSADVEYVSESEYFDEFGEIAEEYNKEEVESTIALSKQLGNWSGIISGIYTKDLEEDADRDETLQRLPEIQIDYLSSRIGDTPFFAQFESTSTYFWRREGLKGERVDIRPSLSAFFNPGQVLEIEPEVGYQQRMYWTSSEGSGYEHEEHFDFSTRFSSRVSRIFDFGTTEGLTKIKHSVEPEVTYFYTPNVNQDYLPYFDSEDRVKNKNQLEYALVHRFVGRFVHDGNAPTYRDIVYLRTAQIYDIWVSHSGRESKEGRDRFSLIRNELIIRPTERWSIDLDMYYDPHRNEFSKYSAETSARYSDDVGFSAAYRYIEYDSEYVDTSVDLDLLKPVYLKYVHRHDMVEHQRLEDFISLEYRAQCWSIFVSYRERIDDDQQIMFTFSLGGIGAVGHVGASLHND